MAGFKFNPMQGLGNSEVYVFGFFLKISSLISHTCFYALYFNFFSSNLGGFRIRKMGNMEKIKYMNNFNLELESCSETLCCV